MGQHPHERQDSRSAKGPLATNASTAAPHDQATTSKPRAHAANGTAAARNTTNRIRTTVVRRRYIRNPPEAADLEARALLFIGSPLEGMFGTRAHVHSPQGGKGGPGPLQIRLTAP